MRRASAAFASKLRIAAHGILNHPLWGKDGRRAGWIIPLFGLLLVTLLWTAALTRIGNEYRLIRDAAARQVESVVATFEQHTLLTIASADATALTIKYLFERDGRVDINGLVAHGLIPARAYLVISVANAAGKVTHSSNPQAVGLDIRDREYFKRHEHDDADVSDISKPVLLRVTGRYAVQVTRRLNQPDGSFAGIVLLSVDPEIFTDFFNAAIQGEMGGLAVVGTDGAYRARRVGMQPATTPEAPPVRVLAAAEQASVGRFTALSPIDGVKRMVAYRKLRDYPLIVVGSLAEQEVMAPFLERRATYLWTVSIATVVSVIFFSIITALASFLQQSRRKAWQRARDLALASRVYETTADGIMLSDSDDRVIMLNAAFTKLTGFTLADMLGTHVADSPFRPLDTVAAAARMDRLMSDGVVTGEVKRFAKDGSTLWLWVTATCARDDDGVINNFVRVYTDISPLKAAQQKLEDLASVDTLTGLPNRRLLDDRLAQALLRTQRHKGWMAVMFVDLDGFKAVNDSLGHDVGDQLLRETARRLQLCLRANDTLARLGGDEFVIVIEGELATGDAAVVGARILAALTPAMELGVQRVNVTASIGIATYPADGTDAATLLKHADVAMYRAKCSGRNRFEFFSAAPAPAVS